MHPSTEDTRFDMPGVDDPPATELGVILLGLDTERLLAGLGAATAVDDDPTVVVLRVDQIRHGVRQDRGVVAEGARRWRSARPAMAAADPAGPPQVAALRPLWTYAGRVVAGLDLGTLGAAARAFLAACWLRRTDVDRFVEELHVVPALDP
ncbi:MAG TPA: DUF6187 family protein [Actinophytocola sp.]|uniref:DUF6187 family protein n=1 Tax=Actinophytocola sp. TaxID=1872138 RepID=UPI002DDD3D2D|nr:DUF6187 family protein [Actinophytocola sp.]HEV2781213.1 DUF6187 family protein [Actinophytocola sp.]